METAWSGRLQLGHEWVCGRVGRGLRAGDGALVALRQSKSRNLQIHVLASGARFPLIALVLGEARDREARLTAENERPPSLTPTACIEHTSTPPRDSLHPATRLSPARMGFSCAFGNPLRPPSAVVQCPVHCVPGGLAGG